MNSNQFFLFVTCLFIVGVDSARDTGKVKTDNKGFAFLTKFSFDYESHNHTKSDQYPGKIELSLKIENTDKGPDSDADPAVVTFYDDEDGSWPSIYKKHVDCMISQNQSKHPDRHEIHWGGSREFKLGSIFIDQHVRPRFWYVAITDCDDSLRGLTVSYDVKLTNQLEGSWSVEFGVAQRHLNSIYIVFLVAYIFLFLMQLNAIWVIKREAVGGGVHPIVTLFTMSLCLEFLSVICQMSHWTKFTGDGIGSEIASILGDAFQVLAHITFLLLLILIGQGWTITTNEIAHKKQVLIGIAIFTLAYGVTLIAQRALDPASVSYIYLSAPGIVVVVLNVFAGVWFCYSIYKVLQTEDDREKRLLYKTMVVVYSLWFWALAIVAIIVELTIPPWYQDTIVVGAIASVDTLAYSVMVWLLWPSRSESYFRITASNIHKPRIGDHFEKL